MKTPWDVLFATVFAVVMCATQSFLFADGGDPAVPLPPIPKEITAADLAAAKATTQTEEQTKALLLHGAWIFKGNSWSNVRVFRPDGSFSKANGSEKGMWKIADGMVVLMFPGRQDRILLPLDPKGSKGIDSKNFPMVTAQVPDNIPVEIASAAPKAAKTPRPERVVASAPEEAPGTAAVPPLSGAPQDPALTAMLAEGEWYFLGPKWAAIRVFKQNGILARKDGAQIGTWGVDRGELVLSMAKYQQKVQLPLDPHVGWGTDQIGRKMILFRQAAEELPPEPASEITPGMLEAAKNSRQSPAEITALLTNGTWLFQGKSWSNTRTFSANGTFKGSGDGKWKIENGMVVVISAFGSDRLLLPLTEKGTNGIDAKDIPMVAIHQAARQARPKMANTLIGNHSAQSDSTIKGILTQGEWYFAGKALTYTRVFGVDGNIYDGRNRTGTWKIVEGFVVMSYAEDEELLKLPIDPQGTIGQDADGLPMLALQQPHASEEPAPVAGNTLAPGAAHPLTSPSALDGPPKSSITGGSLITGTQMKPNTPSLDAFSTPSPAPAYAKPKPSAPVAASSPAASTTPATSEPARNPFGVTRETLLEEEATRGK